MKDHQDPKRNEGEADVVATRVDARLKVTHRDGGGCLSRPIHVALDGRELSVLKSGKECVREIEPGHHRVRFDNTFWPQTVEFDVEPGEQVPLWSKQKGFGS